MFLDSYFLEDSDLKIALDKITNFLINDGILVAIISHFKRYNYELYLVGGAIRDSLLNKDFSDIDLVTNISPERVCSLFDSLGYKTKLIGRFQMVEIEGIKVASFREDYDNTGVYSECKTRRVKTIQEDLKRRDFTFNALAWNLFTGEFHDPFHGRADLLDRRIKFIGDSEQRIKESYERIIRACRMFAIVDGYFDKNTLYALREYSYEVCLIPIEKMRMELKAAMKIKKASLFFEALHLIGALEYIFPSLNACWDQDGGPNHAETIFKHCMEVGDSISTRYWRVKLAGYLHDVGKPPCAEISAETMRLRFRKHPEEGAKLVEEELTRLGFIQKEVRYISSLTKLHMTSFKTDFSDKAVRRFLVKLEKEKVDYKDWMRLLIADRKGNFKYPDFSFRDIYDRVRVIKELYKKDRMFSIKDLAINGNDIMHILNIPNGPSIGLILNNLFEECLMFPERNNRYYLRKRVEDIKENQIIKLK